jgi:hypothetical protein
VRAKKIAKRFEFFLIGNKLNYANLAQAFTSESNRMVFLFELYEKYTANLFTKEKVKKKKKRKMSSLKIFEDKQVRSHWDEAQERWYFSIVDVIAILTESPIPRKYWSVLKTKLKAEGSQLATNCSQLKMKSADGKFYKTDVAVTNL